MIETHVLSFSLLVAGSVAVANYVYSLMFQSVSVSNYLILPMSRFGLAFIASLMVCLVMPNVFDALSMYLQVIALNWSLY